MIQENVVNDNTIMVCGKIAFHWTVPATSVLGAFFDTFPERMKFALINRKDGDAPYLRNLLLISPLASVGQLLYLRARVKEKGYNSLPLLELLRMGRDFVCRDPRDKVYALLGLASDLDILRIEPNYSKPPAEVLTDTALRILRTSSNLDLLNSVDNSKEIKLPSWVPDWSPPKSRFLFRPRSTFMPSPEYCASANTVPIFDFDADDSVLIVHGAIIDSIRCSAGDPTINISLLAQAPDAALIAYPRMIGVLRKICEDLGYQANSENIPAKLTDPLARTIIAGEPLYSELEERYYSACFLAYRKMCQFWYEMARSKRTCRAPLLEQPDMITQAESSKFSTYSTVAEGRSLCVTKNSRLCLAPSETRVGDSVAIFYGGRTAYILRPVGEDFEFLGEAYIHGLMKGEALEDTTFQMSVQKIRLI